MRAREDFLERLDDLDLGSREAAAIDVRAVRKEREHTLRAELREAVQVEVLAIDRRLIDLEIARVHDRPGRARDRERHAARHAVRDPDELDDERPDGHLVPRPDRLEAILRVDAVLHELWLDQRKGHRRAVDRTVEERQHVGDAADVILVAVRQHERLHLVATCLEIGKVRDDQVHPQLIGLREHDAGIDEDGRFLPRDGHHVHAELAEAPERNDLERGRRHDRYGGLIHAEPSNGTSCRPRPPPWQVVRRESGRWERLKKGKGQRRAKDAKKL